MPRRGIKKFEFDLITNLSHGKRNSLRSGRKVYNRTIEKNQVKEDTKIFVHK